MRKVYFARDDFELFHQDMNPTEYEFYRNHIGTFKRMWHDQGTEYWRYFVRSFNDFLWHYGVMRDFPMTVDETRELIDEIIKYIQTQFVDGKVSMAKTFIMDCVLVTQNRNCIVLLDKGSMSQNPFYVKDTREVFRKLFGTPDKHRTYLKLLCGLQVFIKFAGAVVIVLRRWLEATEVPPTDSAKQSFLGDLVMRQSHEIKRTLHRIQQRQHGEMEAKKRINEVKPLSELPEHLGLTATSNEESKIKKRKKKKKTPSAVVETTPTDQTIVVKDESCDKATPPIDDGPNPESNAIFKDAVNDLLTTLNVPGMTKEQCVAAVPCALSTACEKLYKYEQTVKTTPPRPLSPMSRIVEKAKAQHEKEVGPIPPEKESEYHFVGRSRYPKRESLDHVTTTKKEPPDHVTTTKKESVDHVTTDEDHVTGSKRFHTCNNCDEVETVPKTFKRCQRCRGRPNPAYYCSKACQGLHWSVHKLDHKS